VRRTDWLFISGTVLFVAGAAVVVRSLGHPAGGLLLAGLGGIVASVLCFGIAAWRIHTRVDWERVEAEQRLWESGALGRAWLRIRQALLGR
jgi:hypothetical protein